MTGDDADDIDAEIEKSPEGPVGRDPSRKARIEVVRTCAAGGRQGRTPRDDRARLQPDLRVHRSGSTCSPTRSLSGTGRVSRLPLGEDILAARFLGRLHDVEEFGWAAGPLTPSTQRQVLGRLAV